MKKSITKLLSVMLVLAMLIPMMGIMTSAESSEIENLWKGKTLPEMAYTYVGKTYPAVQAGDTVTIGPVSPNTYKSGTINAIIRYQVKVSNTKSTPKYLYLQDATNVINVGKAYILQYKIPDGAVDGSVRINVASTFFESTLITVNRTFDAEEYLAYMKQKGVDTSFILPEEYTGVFENAFPVSDTAFNGIIEGTYTDLATGNMVIGGTKDQNYYSSSSIPVEGGDIVCFGGNVYSVCFVDSEYNSCTLYLFNTNYYKHLLNYCDDVKALVVPKGATSMYVTAIKASYKAGEVAVTVNQPMISYKDYQICLGNFDTSGVNITVNTANEDLVYSGTPKTPKVTLTDTSALGIDFEEGVDYTLSYENNVNAGTATVTANFIGNFTGSVSQTFTIAPRPIVLVWGEDEMMYSGASFTPSAKAFGLLNGDVCDVIVSGSGVTVGTYTAEAVALSNSNYALPENATCEFTITFNPYLFAYEAGCIIYDAASDRIVDAASDLAENAAQVVTNELEKASDKAEAVVTEKIEELAVEAEKAASELATEVEETVENAYAQVDDFFSNLMNIFGW